MHSDVVSDVSYAEGVMRGEVLGVERRRRWNDDDKLAIVCMRSLCPIEIFGSSRLTGSGLACLRARQGVPGELISEDVAAA